MKLTPSVTPFTSRPPTLTEPSLGRSSPDTMLSVVDLPQPVGPTTAQNWPGSTVNETSRSAVNTSPAGVRNRLVSPEISTRALSWPAFSATGLTAASFREAIWGRLLSHLGGRGRQTLKATRCYVAVSEESRESCVDRSSAH
jgi:hypothetical protein